jgi:hypothetical protein
MPTAKGERVRDPDAVKEFFAARGESLCHQQGVTSPARAAELIAACDVFGINPNESSQLLSFRSEAATEYEGAWSTLVTAGGLKLRCCDGMRRGIRSCDAATVERLKHTFGCYTKTPRGEPVELPLPENLTLPRESVTGYSTSGVQTSYRGTYTRPDSEAEVRRRERLAATQSREGDDD